MVSNKNKNAGTQAESAALELADMRRELEDVRARLAEEAAYYRAELEASRQRRDRDNTRLQAEEVARRRQIEQELLRVKAELLQAQEQGVQLQQRNEELNRALNELVATQAERERKAVAAERDAARLAWQEAEQELERQERELDATQRLVATLQSANQELSDEQAVLHEVVLREQRGREDAEQLVVSLKKALWNTAHARRQAETALISLRADIKAQLEESEEPAAEPDSEGADNAGFQRASYHEVSEEALKTVFFGDLSTDLADDFLLTTADASLDRETVDQLRSIAEPVEAATAKEPEREPRSTWPPPLPAEAEPLRVMVPMREARQAPEPVFGERGGMRRLLLHLTVAALATAVIYWLSAANGLERLLAWLAP